MRRMLVADDDSHILALLVRIGERAGFKSTPRPTAWKC
jgi:hypothetical protein